MALWRIPAMGAEGVSSLGTVNLSGKRTGYCIYLGIPELERPYRYGGSGSFFSESERRFLRFRDIIQTELFCFMIWRKKFLWTHL